MKVLGIESSCDETAVSIVQSDKTILSNIVFSQLKEHEAFGGVVPEIAARSHVHHLHRLAKQSLEEADISIKQIDAIAATAGPGLIGGVMVGVMFAKGICSAANKPFIAVNHLEAHALTARLTSDLEFPYLLLLMSGGHCQILVVKGIGKYTKLGGTIDDAIGECFDKTAKLLGLPYPGGVSIEKRAKLGNEKRFQFSRPLLKQKNCNFSFSGLKTSVRNTIGEISELSEQDINDICASFQYTVTQIVLDRLQNAFSEFCREYSDIPNKNLVIAGGVASNQYLRKAMQLLSRQSGFELIAPPPKLCTDNGAMVAWTGLERLKLNMINSIDFEPKSRWGLENLQ